MNIQVRKTNRVNVLVLSGRMGIGGGDALLREEFLNLFEAGERRFVFDMRGLSSADSAGLGEMIACQKRVGATGERIRIVVDRSSKIHDFVMTAHLHRVFRVFADENAAVASFGKKALL